MSVTTNLHDALSQGRATVPRQQTFAVLGDAAATERPLPPHASQHPLAGKMRGESIEAQVRHILADRCQFLNEHPSRRVMNDRCSRITSCYADLKEMGFPISDVTTFGLRHAKMLLSGWREKGLSPKTIYNRWSALRSWSLTLNKHGMLGPLEELWPDFSQTSQKSTCAPRLLTPEQISTRSDWLRVKSDKTAYLVDRLCREVGLTREEALQVDRAQAMAITKGQTYMRCGQGPNARTYTTVAAHWELFREVVDFMTERNRTSLCWSGLEIQAAIDKYALRMSYVARCLFPKEEGSAKGNQV